MDNLINGFEKGVLSFLQSLIIIIPALITYACFNSLKNKYLVILFGFGITTLIAFLSAFKFHYMNWNNFGIGISALYIGLILGIIGGKLFPWHKEVEEKMFTSKEIARILYIPEQTVIKWVKSRMMFGILHGNGAKIPLGSFMRWLEKFSMINSAAHHDQQFDWINKTMIEKSHLIRVKKENHEKNF